MTGMLVGTAIFAALYPRLDKAILGKGHFGELTLPQLLKVKAWWVILFQRVLRQRDRRLIALKSWVF
jgi:hypothetical protein